jgi:hypothetical protein
MRFSSILALGAFILPALASPLLNNNNVGVNVEDVLKQVNAIVPVNAKRNVISTPTDVIETCQGLLVTIKAHTAVINQTVSEVPVGQQCTDAQVSVIKVQLNLVVDLVKTVTIALGAVKTVLKCTEAEVATIVQVVVAIVLEVVCTLIYVIKTLNIQALLTVILGNLCQVLAGLILILEGVVGGVLALVLGCLNVPAILELVSCVLGNLILSLTAGKILSVL